MSLAGHPPSSRENAHPGPDGACVVCHHHHYTVPTAATAHRAERALGAVEFFDMKLVTDQTKGKGPSFLPLVWSKNGIILFLINIFFIVFRE